jgi:hypothetical protein
MGYSISWLAYRGLAPQIAYRRLGLTETARTAEYARAKFTAHGLPHGWHLIVADRCDHTMVRAPSLAALSVGCEVVACSVEEHVMVCWSEHWREGARRWRIEHSSEKGPTHLASEGERPEAWAAWLADAEAAQAADPDVDAYFEVPLQAAQQLAGFKHDETHAALHPDSFLVLEPEGGGRKWWHWGR